MRALRVVFARVYAKAIWLLRVAWRNSVAVVKEIVGPCFFCRVHPYSGQVSLTSVLVSLSASSQFMLMAVKKGYALCLQKLDSPAIAWLFPVGICSFGNLHQALIGTGIVS